MISFKEIFNKLNCPNLTVSSYKRLKSSIDKLENWIAYICYEENDDSYAIKELRNKIYSFYSNQINDLINKYEVYFHDFSTQVSIIIMDLVKELASCSSHSKDSDIECALRNAYDILYCLHFILCIEIIYYCLSRVNQYKKTLKRFNFKGVYYTPQDTANNSNIKKFSEVMNENENKLRESLMLYEDVFYDLISKKDSKTAFYDLDKIESVMQNVVNVDELSNAVKEACNYLNDAENHFAEIINNGYNSTIVQKCINFFIFWALPVILAIITVVSISL